MPVFEPWPVERTERARQMWDEGYTAGQIGSILGLSRNAIIGKSHRQGWGRRGPDSPRRGISRSVRIARPPKPRNPRSDNNSIAWMLKAPKIIKPVPVEPSRDTARTLMHLSSRTCRWPVGEVTGRDQLFCGASKDFDHTYCEYHRLKAYGRGTESERRAIRGMAA